MGNAKTKQSPPVMESSMAVQTFLSSRSDVRNQLALLEHARNQLAHLETTAPDDIRMELSDVAETFGRLTTEISRLVDVGAGPIDRAFLRAIEGMFVLGRADQRAFAARALELSFWLAQHLPSDALATALASANDAGALIEALKQPEAASVLTAPDDQLTAAKLRGVEDVRELLAEEGGTLGLPDVAELLHMTPQGVTRRRQKGQLIAIRMGAQGYRYPGWQFTLAGDVLPGLPRVLGAIADKPPLAQMYFMLSSNAYLDDLRPLDLLRQGLAGRVLEAVERGDEMGSF